MNHTKQVRGGNMEYRVRPIYDGIVKVLADVNKRIDYATTYIGGWDKTQWQKDLYARRDEIMAQLKRYRK